MRSQFTSLNDEQLLAQCEIDTYRASGPGGQKRNKTSSAVRIRHLPSELIVIAEESRSQHDNRAKAFKRLKQAFFLKLRESISPSALSALPRTVEGRLELGVKDPRFWPAAGLILDVLEEHQARLAESAQILGITTGNLNDFLALDPKVWAEVNHLRSRFGQKPLK